MPLLLGRISFALFGHCYFSLFYHPSPCYLHCLSKDSARENVVLHSKIIDFGHSVVTHLVVALTSLWEEFGGCIAQLVGTGVTL